MKNIVTTQRTSKKLKIHLALSTVMTIVTLICAMVGAASDLDFAPLFWAFLICAVWRVTTGIVIWWHHD